MIATEAILVIAFCLAVVAVIGIRIALSLADIEKSLDRVAKALEGRAADHAVAAVRAGAAGDESTGNQTRSMATDDSEIAAAIAAAARYRKAPLPATSAKSAAAHTSIEATDDGNGIVDAAAERT